MASLLALMILMGLALAWDAAPGGGGVSGIGARTHIAPQVKP